MSATLSCLGLLRHFIPSQYLATSLYTKKSSSAGVGHVIQYSTCSWLIQIWLNNLSLYLTSPETVNTSALRNLLPQICRNDITLRGSSSCNDGRIFPLLALVKIFSYESLKGPGLLSCLELAILVETWGWGTVRPFMNSYRRRLTTLLWEGYTKKAVSFLWRSCMRFTPGFCFQLVFMAVWLQFRLIFSMSCFSMSRWYFPTHPPKP